MAEVTKANTRLHKGQTDMTTKTTVISVAGIELTAVKTDDGYGVSVKEYEAHLGLDSDFTRDLKRGKRPEYALEAGFETGVSLQNVRVGRNTKAFIDTKDLVKLIGVFATRGNKTALSWLVALANETLERRIDNALGTQKTEQEYEVNTQAFFRQLSKETFHPKYTTWISQDKEAGVIKQNNWGVLVNQLKKAAALPYEPVESYNEANVKRWIEAIMVYNAHRSTGLTHRSALTLIAGQFASAA